MMRLQSPPIGLALAGLLPLLVAAAPLPLAPKVDTQRMSDMTRVLASDEFQGRAPGSPGEEKTIPYLVSQFKEAGLEPAGENGGGGQTGPVIHTPPEPPGDLSGHQGGEGVPPP